MKFQVKKIENCFADSETYEYLLPVTGEAFLSFLQGWEVRVNRKLRRPVGIACREAVTIKCTLAGSAFRVSFPQNNWAAEKLEFEQFLENLL